MRASRSTGPRASRCHSSPPTGAAPAADVTVIPDVVDALAEDDADGADVDELAEGDADDEEADY